MSNTVQYKCPCCAGAIEFDSDLQKMKCPYCDTEFDVETLKGYDEQLKKDRPDKLEWQDSGNEWTDAAEQGVRSYICKACGGEIIGDETLAATSCPFCGNPTIFASQLSGALKPDCVIPFKLNKEDAKAALSRHLKGKLLLPKVFKDQNHIDEIRGIYVPFWLFDATADADIRFRTTRVRSWRSGDYQYTETKHYAVIREGDVAFARVPVDASRKMPDDLMESLEPYDYSEAVDFQTAYLSGYLADKYDVEVTESSPRAAERIKASTEEEFESTVHGYSSVRVENSNVTLKNSVARYALYPVWLLNTTYKDQKYVFAMNGQTGKFVGNLPVDKGAFIKYLLLFGIAAAAVVFLIMTIAGI